MTTDLTTGKPMKRLVSFTVPILIGNIFQQLYSMADTLIVGRTIGLQALAAVGATGAVSFLIIGFVQGMTSGFAVITAQQFGAQNEEGVRRSAAMAIKLSILVTIVVTLASTLLARPLLELMRTPTDILDQSYDYIFVVFLGTAATVLYNLFSCLIRALGDSKTPLYFLIFASVLNVGLDLLFILVFQMGVAGAGWATVLSQAISGILCVVYSLRRFSQLRLRKEDWKREPGFAWKHLRVGLPMAFQFSITGIGIMVMQWALNGFGSTTVAAYTAASKIDTIAMQPLFSLGTTTATYVAQNHGAGRVDRIREGIRKCMYLNGFFSVLGFVLPCLLSKSLIALFVNDTSADQMPQVIQEGQLYLLLNTSCYFLLGIVFIYRNALQGMNHSGITVFAGVAELFMRVLAAVLFAKLWGYAGVCAANPVAWFGADVFLVITYAVKMRQNRNMRLVSSGLPSDCDEEEKLKI